MKHSLRSIALAGGLMLTAVPVWAQSQAPQVDPRIVQQLVASQQAEIALRDAIIKVQTADAEKKALDLSVWFRGWFGQESEK